MTARERRVGDVTKLTTENGQLIVEIVSDGAILRDPTDFRPVAKVASRDRYEITKLVRRVCSFLKHKKALEELGVQLAPDSLDVLMDLFKSKGWNREQISPERRTALETALHEKEREGGRRPKRSVVLPVMDMAPRVKKP